MAAVCDNHTAAVPNSKAATVEVAATTEAVLVTVAGPASSRPWSKWTVAELRHHMVAVPTVLHPPMVAPDPKEDMEEVHLRRLLRHPWWQAMLLDMELVPVTVARPMEATLEELVEVKGQVRTLAKLVVCRVVSRPEVKVQVREWEDMEDQVVPTPRYF